MITVRNTFIAMASLLIAADAQAQSMPEWRLQESRDSFVIMVQGREVGYTVMNIERTPEGDCRVVENTKVGEMMKQRTHTLVAACTRITEVVQTGTSRGQEMKTDLKYANGRVTGISITPGPNGPTTQQVNLEVPANVVDVNLLQTVLGQLPWTDTSQWTIPLFSSGKNAMSTMDVKVVGSEALSTAAGEVETYRVELGGDVVTARVWVTKAQPHRILKFAPNGSPMEMIYADARQLLRSLMGLALDSIRKVLSSV